jgi:hypothetical protein
MKVLTVLLLASLPVPQIHTARSQPHFAQQATAAVPRKGGKWYLARTGHAVYCFGPVLTLTANDGGVERVATFCRGEKMMVPLKD